MMKCSLALAAIVTGLTASAQAAERVGPIEMGHRSTDQLPARVDLGSTSFSPVPARKGVSIGGSDASAVFADAFLLRLGHGRLVREPLTPLPAQRRAPAP